MYNPGVIALIILAILLTVSIVASLIYIAVKQSEDTPSGGNVILPPCSERTDISSLVQIPNTLQSCEQNGRATSLYYIGSISNLDYVVAPWGTQPFDVCIGFCTGYTGGICSGSNYNGKSAQDNFNSCMIQLAVTGCAPPSPIAAKGTTIYYPFSPTCKICDNCSNINININVE